MWWVVFILAMLAGTAGAQPAEPQRGEVRPPSEGRAPANGHNGAGARELLERAIGAYNFSRYELAIELFSEVLYPPKLDRDDPDQLPELKRAHEYLGICYLIKKQPVEAKRVFLALLDLDPAYQMDPLRVVPEFVDYFQSVRGEHDRQRREEELRQREREREERLAFLEEQYAEYRNLKAELEKDEGPAAIETVREVAVLDWYDALVPAGYLQFKLDEDALAWSFLGIEVATCTASATLWTYLWVDGRPPGDGQKAFLAATGGACLATYAAQVVVGLLAVDESPTRVLREQTVPIERRRTSLDLAPVGSGVGLRLSLDF